jgi:hypothetical protein
LCLLSRGLLAGLDDRGTVRGFDLDFQDRRNAAERPIKSDDLQHLDDLAIAQDLAYRGEGVVVDSWAVYDRCDEFRIA